LVFFFFFFFFFLFFFVFRNPDDVGLIAKK
jgi:hypothetical protein